MGLCKCPKRRVTNLFCFVHRVPVCEDCMVAQHPRCVIQSYLKWLEDSDFDPVCAICSKSFQEGDVMRLVCHDLFHISCLDSYARSLPHNTAPAGYRCPKCKEALFPPLNMMSPVADRMRQTLGAFSWAKEGLGITEFAGMESGAGPKSVFEEDAHLFDTLSPQLSKMDSREADFEFTPVTSTPKPNHIPASPVMGNFSPAPPPSHTHPHASQVAVQMYDHPVARGGSSHKSSVDGDFLVGSQYGDSDENKYRKKNMLEMFSRWMRLFRQHQRWKVTAEDSRVMQRYLVLVLLAVFVMVTLIVLMTRVGRGVAERDPGLDWRHNPNVRTGD